MQNHTKLLDAKEVEIDAKIKKFYEGFDSEWAERNKNIKEIDEHLKVHNSVEVVRHIRDHYLKKITDHKKDAEDYLSGKKSELNDCKHIVCKTKVQKLIDWTEKTIGHLQKIIKFFEDKIQQYMTKEDIKIIDGEYDDEEDDEVMKSDKKNQKESIKLMKEFNGSDDDDSNVNPINFEGDIEGEDMNEPEDYEESVIPRASN